MPYQQVTHSEMDKENAKWEMLRENCPRGLEPGNPWRPGNEIGKAGAPFPKMLYRAQRVPAGLPGQGKWACSIADPRRFGYRDDDEWNAARSEAERFTMDCQKIVNNEDEFLKAKGQGWRESPKDAVELMGEERIKLGNTVAERNWEERTMSARALAERDAAEKDHFGHLETIPEKPVVRRVKKQAKKKGAAGAAA